MAPLTIDEKRGHWEIGLETAALLPNAWNGLFSCRARGICLKPSVIDTATGSFMLNYVTICAMGDGILIKASRT